MMDYDDSNFGGQGSPYLHVCSRAMTAARAGDGQVRMNYVENAISRAITEFEDRYEKICIGWLPLSQVPHFWAY